MSKPSASTEPTKDTAEDQPAKKAESASADATKLSRLRAYLRRHWHWLTLVAVLVLGGGSAYAWTVLRPTPAPKQTIVNKATPRPTPAPTPIKKASPLTGAMVDPAVADRPIVGVIVENHPDARPQSGLGQAGVVYEANAEGGITRFEAFFLDQQPTTIGPVRSLRTYFLDWGMEFNAPIAHAGGNADALDEVSPLGLKDLNALVIGAPYFYRVSDRYAPHNLYTSSDLLNQLLARDNFAQPANFTPSPRKPDTPNLNSQHPNIHIDYSYNGYQVDYHYDASTNDYARELAGAPHIDRNTGAQIHVKNVVVEYMPTSYGTTRIGESTVIMQTVGTGQGLVFRDGEAIPCTWSKSSRTARTQLLGSDGKDIPLDVGNTWYSIVPVGKMVSY
ncbi:MAG TPA: DUF3048 domain-containing protein [Candidatus Saccharimonadia bacterium]|nr:DUF3048 domain-containing protein [Candidatus Saccharimonadia bacterium]